MQPAQQFTKWLFINTGLKLRPCWAEMVHLTHHESDGLQDSQEE